MNQDVKVAKIAIAGANGRMGIELIKLCLSNNNVELVEALVRPTSSALGKSVDYLINDGLQKPNLLCTSQSSPLKGSTQVLIDFTLPDNTLKNLQRCVDGDKALVIGTTGFSKEQQSLINQASHKIAILQASNMSIGVNLTLALLKQTARVLGAEIKVDISETHHVHKIDSPSGTAITMGEVIANSFNKNLDECLVIDDKLELESETGKIKFNSIREGEVIGDHRVSFIMDDEVIEISHSAINRKVFAKGAIKAAIWLSDKEPGIYSMDDVLGLN
ncbi:MAG: 4-hydroxy-tetrahydrodipicolinate reductase [Enterobacterales bacterium]|jgi:4-hydroxy-tetrahydrodipicolinate reductase